MTGMGRARGKVGSAYLFAEVKSVNHRYCEVNVRLPGRLQLFELSLVASAKKRINRGKLDITVFDDKDTTEVSYNPKALKAYYLFLKSIKKDLKFTEPITLTHIQNGMSFWLTKDSDVGKLGPALIALVNKALDQLMLMRAKEGSELTKQLKKRVAYVRSLKALVSAERQQIEVMAKEKLRQRIEKILEHVDVDPGKLANEVAYLIERADVTEELDRLDSHFKQMEAELNSKKPVGRSLDFMIQEMNREWNTIASKSQNTNIAKQVIEAKAEMEKIREQVQNIE